MRLITSVNTEQLQVISTGVADVDNLNSIGAADGDVLTADGVGGTAWEAIPVISEGEDVLSTGAADGLVLTADGAGGSVWEAVISADSTTTFINKTIEDLSNVVHANSIHTKVHNKTGSTIYKGQPLSVSSWEVDEEAERVILASNLSGPANYLAEEDILNNEYGPAIAAGILTGLNTLGTGNYTNDGGGWDENTILYVDGTGKLTKNEPTAGFSQPIAMVIRAKNDGALHVLAAYPKQAAEDVRYTSTQQADEAIDSRSRMSGFPVDSSGNYYCSLAYDEATRTVTLTPTDTSFNIYADGIRHNIVGVQTIQHTDEHGAHYIYYDNTGTLVSSRSVWSLSNTAPVVYIFWDAVNDKGICVHERHHAGRDIWMHARLHRVDGTQVVSGFTLNGYTEDVGTTDAAIQWGMSSGVLADEDLFTTVTAHTGGGVDKYVILERSGADGTWLINKDQVLPILYSGNSLQYNQWTGTVWQRTNVTEDQFVNYYILGVPSLNSLCQLVIVPGQTLYSTETLATTESVNNLNWGIIPFGEIAPLYQLTVRFNANAPAQYSNTARCSIVRVTKIVGSKSTITQAAQTDHGGLAGLLDDDHTQYHNDARGDARYATLAHEHTGLDSTGVTDGYVLTADGVGGTAWEAAASNSIVTYTLSTLPGHGVVPDATVADWAAVQSYTPSGDEWVECTNLDGNGTFLFRFTNGYRLGPFGAWVKNPRYVLGSNSEDVLVVNCDPSTLADSRPTNFSDEYGHDGNQNISRNLQVDDILWCYRRFGSNLPIYTDIANHTSGKRIEVINNTFVRTLVLGANSRAGQYIGLGWEYDGGTWEEAVALAQDGGKATFEPDPGATYVALDEATHAGLAGVMSQGVSSVGNYRQYLSWYVDSTTGILELDSETMPRYGSMSGIGYGSTMEGWTNLRANKDYLFQSTVADVPATWTFPLHPDVEDGDTVRFRLMLENGGTQTQTWPAGLTWIGGTPTFTTSGMDLLEFWTSDLGTTWYGYLVAGNISVSLPTPISTLALLHLDGNLTDKAGGTWVLGGTGAGYATGKWGSSLDCKGTGYAHLTGPQIDLGSDNWTAEAWIYRNVSNSSGTILSINSAPGGYAALYLQLQSNGYISYLCSGSGTSWDVHGFAVSPPVGEWSHIAVVREGSAFSLYINGTRASQIIWNGGSLLGYSGSYGTYIGAITQSTNANFYIDEVRISSGVIYSGATVSIPSNKFGESIEGEDVLSTGATGGYVLTADGAGGAAWEPTPVSGGGQYISVTTLSNGANITGAYSGGLLLVNSATEATLTLTNDATGGWTTGAVVDLMSLGAGRVIVQQGSGVTINGAAVTASPILYRAHHRVTLIRTGTNAWSAIGASTLMALGYNGVVKALYPLDGNLDEYTGGSAMSVTAGTVIWEADSVVSGGQCLTGTAGVVGYCTFAMPPNTITGTADWTIEGWFKALQASTAPLFLRDAVSSNNLSLSKIAATNILQMNLGASGGAVISGATVGTVNPGDWFHIAIVRASGAVRVYLNGGLTYENTSVAGSAITTGITAWLGGNTAAIGLGEFKADQLRISSAALYTENFVPAQQLVAL